MTVLLLSFFINYNLRRNILPFLRYFGDYKGTQLQSLLFLRYRPHFCMLFFNLSVTKDSLSLRCSGNEEVLSAHFLNLTVCFVCLRHTEERKNERKRGNWEKHTEKRREREEEKRKGSKTQKEREKKERGRERHTLKKERERESSWNAVMSSA